MIIHEVPFSSPEAPWRGAFCVELGGLNVSRRARVLRDFRDASMAQNVLFDTQQVTYYRWNRPPKTKYQSGEGSGGGGFFSASTSSAYGSQMARAYDGTCRVARVPILSSQKS